MSRSKYSDLGVDVHKRGIDAFRDATSGAWKHAFCDIYPEPDMPGYGFVLHSDGGGSKPVQNYLNWKVTGDVNCFGGVAQDTLAMNIGDVFCVGVPTVAYFVDYIAINGLKVTKRKALEIVADEWAGLFKMLGEFGIYMSLAGGETADLPDQLRTLDVSGAIYSRYKLDSVITGEDIKPGDTIIGLASGGKAKYEKKPSGALMCNGITLARHSLMKPELAVLYPEITEPGKEYTGPFSPTDKVQGVDGTIGEEITRPTRIFAPPFKGVIEKFGKAVHGIVFNTGGGHTKCLRIGHGIRYVKDDLPKPPAIFRLIQKYGHVPWREMYVDFNMGVGAELYVDPAASSEVLGFVREEFGIETRRIGQCKLARGDNKVRLETRHGNFNHRKNKVK